MERLANEGLTNGQTNETTKPTYATMATVPRTPDRENGSEYEYERERSLPVLLMLSDAREAPGVPQAETVEIFEECRT